MIRPARPADLPLLPAIEVSAGELFAGTHMDFARADPPSDPATLGAALAEGLLWVAEADGAVAGFLLAESAPPDLYLRELAVAGHAQRRGLGHALLEAAVAHAAALGCPAVLLTTDRTLPWNAPFYARHGFAVVEDDAIPPLPRHRLAAQVAAGFDPAWRCAMVRRLA